MFICQSQADVNVDDIISVGICRVLGFGQQRDRGREGEGKTAREGT